MDRERAVDAQMTQAALQKIDDALQWWAKLRDSTRKFIAADPCPRAEIGNPAVELRAKMEKSVGVSPGCSVRADETFQSR